MDMKARLPSVMCLIQQNPKYSSQHRFPMVIAVGHLLIMKAKVLERILARRVIDFFGRRFYAD